MSRIAAKLSARGLALLVSDIEAACRILADEDDIEARRPPGGPRERREPLQQARPHLGRVVLVVGQQRRRQGRTADFPEVTEDEPEIQRQPAADPALPC